VTEVDPRSRAVATGVLLSARVVYAYNWFDIGGVLPLVGTRFSIGTVDLGIVLASFLVGAAVFQLPAGYAAMRWGSRATSIVALGVMGAFALASAASPNWIVLALLRFGAGGGAAFFFAPALGLVTAYYPSGHRGFMVGAYNAAFSVGSGVGLFASALLGPTTGWALPIGLGGGLLLGVMATALFALPPTPDEARVPARWMWAESRPVLRSLGLWGVAIGGGGLWGGFYIAAQYFVAFAHQIHPSWSLALAAAAPTIMIAVEVAGGPIGGWFGERSRDMRRALVAWGVVAGVLLAAIPFLPLAAVVAAFAVLGFSNGVTFTLLYLIPTYLPQVTVNRVALGLAFVNFVQILIGSAIALGFALVASAIGYSGGWIFAGVATLAFLPALLLSSTSGRRRSPVGV
jgi:predicted MFS family arabinose efflux permease